MDDFVLEVASVDAEPEPVRVDGAFTIESVGKSVAARFLVMGKNVKGERKRSQLFVLQPDGTIETDLGAVVEIAVPKDAAARYEAMQVLLQEYLTALAAVDKIQLKK